MFDHRKAGVYDAVWESSDGSTDEHIQRSANCDSDVCISRSDGRHVVRYFIVIEDDTLCWTAGWVDFFLLD